MMFESFRPFVLHADGVRINGVIGGQGPPVLLLHGYPETHAMWHRVAPILAEDFTVVCTDLRGYGDSEAVSSEPTHEPYSKRAMGDDQLRCMRQLGYERFVVVGHDRGARVARRLALDHPTSVTSLVILDIVPTAEIYERLDKDRATSVWRYLFLVQPFDLPERLVGTDPNFYLDWTFKEWSRSPDVPEEAALAEYRRCFDAETIHASCEDYRAGATVDLMHDLADSDARIGCEVLVLWSATGIGASYDVLDIWRREAVAVRGRALDCGHFLAEECPDEVASEVKAFLRR